MTEKVKISLPRDEIMQRFLARRIWKEAELKVVEIDGTEHIGFITGLDDRCLQMSTSPAHVADEPHAVLVFWPVRRIEETGRRLDELAHEHVSKIRTYGSVLWKRCEAAMRNTGANNGHRNSNTPRQEDIETVFSL